MYTFSLHVHGLLTNTLASPFCLSHFRLSHAPLSISCSSVCLLFFGLSPTILSVFISHYSVCLSLFCLSLCLSLFFLSLSLNILSVSVSISFVPLSHFLFCLSLSCSPFFLSLSFFLFYLSQSVSLNSIFPSLSLSTISVSVGLSILCVSVCHLELTQRLKKVFKGFGMAQTSIHVFVSSLE